MRLITIMLIALSMLVPAHAAAGVCEDVCDKMHQRDSERCGRLRTAKAREACRAQAMRDYSECLAACSRGGCHRC